MAMTTAEEISITVSGIPVELVEEIDRFAAEEDRSRSSFIRRELEQSVDRRKAKEARK